MKAARGALFLLCIIARAALAAREPLGFDAGKALGLVAELSSPAYAGRLTGSEGNRKAMDLVAAKFRELGLEPFADSGNYFQPFEAYLPEINSPALLEVYEGPRLVKAYLRYRDFRETYLGRARPGELRGRASARGSPYEALEPGAPIFLYTGGPAETFDEEPLLGRGVRALILSTDAATVSRKGGSVALHRLDGAEGFIKLIATPAAMAELAAYAAAGLELRLRTDFGMRWVKTANVAGFLPAADGRSDRVELVSAHLDHLGANPDGSYYPGAVDNASGVAVMLGVAEALAARRGELRTAFVFVAFNAEEQGLFGSWNFVERPPLAPKRAELLNLDSIGAAAARRLLLLSCSLSARDDPADPIVARPERRLARLAEARGLELRLERQSYASDHLPFSTLPIAAISLCDDPLGPYHTPADRLEAVDGERLGAVGALALDYLGGIAFEGPPALPVALIAALALAAAFGCGLTRRYRLRLGSWPLLPAAAFLLCGSGLFLARSGLLAAPPRLSASETEAFLARLSAEEEALAALGPGREELGSAANEAAADYLAGRFAALRLSPYRGASSGAEGPGKEGSYFLESRAELPRPRSEPRLGLFGAGGERLASYRRGRDFRETEGGYASGGSVSGAYEILGSAYEAEGGAHPVAVLGAEGYAAADEALFSKRGVKLLLIEGDPTRPLPPPPGPGAPEGSASVRKLEGSSFLRFIVSPALFRELERREGEGLRIGADWELEYAWVYPRSVLGFLPGRGGAARDPLLVAASIDSDPGREGGGGTSLPFLLAFAELLSREVPRPARPLVFAALNGSRAGQLGARAYAAAPIGARPAEPRSMSGEVPNHPFGLVDPYRGSEYDLDRNKASEGLALLLAEGPGPSPLLSLGPPYPSFLLGGQAFADSLARAGQARGLAFAVDRVGGEAGHRVFLGELGGSALTLSLPAPGPGSERAYGALAASLAESLGRLAGPPRAEGEALSLLAAEALLAGLAAALLAAFLEFRLRRRAALRRQAASPDPFGLFLGRGPGGGRSGAGAGPRPGPGGA